MRIFFQAIFCLILTFRRSICTECDSLFPDNVTSCLELTTPTYYCCYFEPENFKNSFNLRMCKRINRAEWLWRSNKTTENGVNYIIHCGDDNFTKLETCGVTNPSVMTNCTNSSSYFNSCCYYNLLGSTGCVSLGAPFFDSILYHNVILQCGSSGLNIRIITLIMLFLVIGFS